MREFPSSNRSKPICSFDFQKIPMYRWPPTHRLLAARFSADLEQLQNWDFATSNCSKPIWVLTRTKCSCSDDNLPIGYSLPNFQQIWSNFFADPAAAAALTRLKGGRHQRGIGLFLKELTMDSLSRTLESYCLHTTEHLAYWMFLMHLPPTIPSRARSEASIFFPTQNIKIRKGRRSCCEILRYPLG